ncbi:MAG TPA: NADH-quinone oxidoreductase subunit L [Thermoflexales bacterium]|nr:NADH-quinone oxidoreductase subunit L [Thermoflexales bacterium]HRA00942.1 NADH-quinone oxidoreductase subunit L [Thermoflexales bacterium]
MILILPILFPLIGLLINAFWGKRLPETVSGGLATAMTALSFVVSLILFAQVAAAPDHKVVAQFGPWISVGKLNVQFGFLVDGLSSIMMLIITGIGSLIHLYSMGYMHRDARYPRFFVYLNLFIASMLTLVMGDSYLLMFVGWELVGLCSYLLIGFWFSKLKNAEAGRKAFVVNRIGDVGFVLGIMLIFSLFGSLNYADVLNEEHLKTIAPALLTAITLLLFVGATGKSAQLPLFVWLPDAMAGPTPVSALIHAATMVTAGIYMMTRSHLLFSAAPTTGEVVAFVGALTALVAGWAAMSQWDIKKVLAYSTVSQLGFMVAAVGMGAYVAGMFHLLTHAFFKGLLFLGSGSVIHGMEHYMHTRVYSDTYNLDPQDMRNMGGLKKRMKITWITFMVGAFALAGVIPLSGFFSKDEILASAVERNPLVFLMLGVTAILTAFYSMRQVRLVFFGEPRTRDAEHARESSPLMTVPLIVLAVLAALGGLLNLPVAGGHWLSHWLQPVMGELEVVEFNPLIAGFFTVAALAVMAFVYLLYKRVFVSKNSVDPLTKLGPLYALSANKWYLDEIYRAIIIKPFYAGASFLAHIADLEVIDGFVNGVGAAFSRAGAALGKLQTGLVRSYALVMLFGIVAIVAWFVLNAR